MASATMRKLQVARDSTDVSGNIRKITISWGNRHINLTWEEAGNSMHGTARHGTARLGMEADLTKTGLRMVGRYQIRAC